MSSLGHHNSITHFNHFTWVITSPPFIIDIGIARQHRQRGPVGHRAGPFTYTCASAARHVRATLRRPRHPAYVRRAGSGSGVRRATAHRRAGSQRTHSVGGSLSPFTFLPSSVNIPFLQAWASQFGSGARASSAERRLQFIGCQQHHGRGVVWRRRRVGSGSFAGLRIVASSRRALTIFRPQYSASITFRYIRSGLAQPFRALGFRFRFLRFTHNARRRRPRMHSGWSTRASRGQQVARHTQRATSRAHTPARSGMRRQCRATAQH